MDKVKYAVVNVTSTLVFLLLMLPVARAQEAQEDNWDVYLAQYDEGVGSTVLNMDLINVAPVKELPFLVVTGLTFDNCPEDGLPSPSQLDRFYEISDTIEQTLSACTQVSW